MRTFLLPALRVAAGLSVGLSVLLNGSFGFADEAQHEEPANVQDMEDYLRGLKISVTSQTPLTTREAPGVVTVLSQDEIRDSHARSLDDLLLTVPGFGLGVDVEGVVGVTVRGNWAHEGKVLFLWNGHPLNERLYSTEQLGNRFPLDQIKRIEIVRGPGSVIYGGFAELGVINIVTFAAEDLEGGRADIQYGQFDHALGRANASLQAGKRFGDLGVKAAAFVGRGNRSDGTYVDAAGNSLFMGAGNAQVNPVQFDLDVGYHDLKLSFLYNGYNTVERDHYTTLTEPVSIQFSDYDLNAEYAAHPSTSLTITPSITLQRDTPWRTDGVSSSGVPPFDRWVDRISGRVTANFDATENLSLLAGITSYSETAHDGIGTFSNGKDTVTYANLGVYGQGILKTSWFNTILGVRAEQHSRYGSSFVPRLAFTKVMDPFHLKLMVSKAFRVPSIQYIELNPDIKPETTLVYELEAGYEITRDMMLTANVFDMSISKPIVYSVTNAGDDFYSNFDRSGTRGFELEYRLRRPGFGGSASYSFYSSGGKNNVDYYAVPGHDDVMLGSPQHKATLMGHVVLPFDLSLHSSFIFFGMRYGYDANGIRGFNPAYLLNVALRKKDLFVKNLEASIGVVNLLGETMVLVQPYNGGHPPLPALPREYTLGLNYSFTI